MSLRNRGQEEGIMSMAMAELYTRFGKELYGIRSRVEEYYKVGQTCQIMIDSGKVEHDKDYTILAQYILGFFRMTPGKARENYLDDFTGEIVLLGYPSSKAVDGEQPLNLAEMKVLGRANLELEKACKETEEIYNGRIIFESERDCLLRMKEIMKVFMNNLAIAVKEMDRLLNFFKKPAN